MTPLELWDLRVGSGILWDWTGREEFGRVLRESLVLLHAGGGETRSAGPVPQSLRGFSGVYFTGGGAATIEASFEDCPWDVWFAANGRSAAELGGTSLLASHGLAGWVVDIGQSALKVFQDGRSRVFPRDYAALPVRSDAASDIALQREALRDFLANSLMACVADGWKAPEAIVCALPSCLDDSGVPDGSSYIGMKGDASLVADSLARSGFAPQLVLLLNDAEVAAVSAGLDPRVQGKVLVLTIGFGVGAALLQA